MLKLLVSFFVIVFLCSCGVDTSSNSVASATPIDNGTVVNPGLDLIDPNPIYSGDTNSTTPGGTTPGGTTPGGTTTTDQNSSIFDITGAIEDKFACMIGDVNDGYTNHSLTDDSIDFLGEFDIEYGIGVNSRLAYNNDIIKTEVTVFYYDLKPTRSNKVVSTYEDQYRVDIDTGWVLNDERYVYVRTPKDQNGLFSCYRYDASSLDLNSTLARTKVYRKKT